jgi:hypothetical protein
LWYTELRQREDFEVDAEVFEKYSAPIFREYVGDMLL